MANEYRVTKANLRVLAKAEDTYLRVFAFRVEVWRTVGVASPPATGSASRRMVIVT